MPLLSNSAQHIASASSSDVPGPESETFKKFFECWLVEQEQDLRELISASSNCADSTQSESTLRPLIGRVISHYEQYYQAKARWAKHDALAMMTPEWRSSLEDTFPWIGGWRPTMAFHLLFSKSGLQLEARLDELIRGLSTGDLGDLSPGQLGRVDELQRETIRRERELTELLAAHQESVADSSMVELSHVVSEMTRSSGESAGEEEGGGGGESTEEEVKSALVGKEEALEGILQKADDLRLGTLKNVIEILTPIQAVHFLIAAAELHLRLHEWGMRRDNSGPHHRPLQPPH
ncbi:hypothetical protein Ancab_024376 [Ancistrocladus abbreviatus]